MNSSPSSSPGRPSGAFGRAKALFLAAAFLSFLLSVALWFSGDREAGLFVGIWVPSICSAGALVLAGRSHE
jgi:hypothetical protein